jgi:hypothetical protein
VRDVASIVEMNLNYVKVDGHKTERQTGGTRGLDLHSNVGSHTLAISLPCTIRLQRCEGGTSSGRQYMFCEAETG